MTNADRIRAMTNKKLAEFLSNLGCPPLLCQGKDCRKCWADYLNREVKDNG